MVCLSMKNMEGNHEPSFCMCPKRSLNGAAFLLNFKPAWLVGKTQFCYFTQRILNILCVYAFICVLSLLVWLGFFKITYS